jgi:hypothetical protein
MEIFQTFNDNRFKIKSLPLFFFNRLRLIKRILRNLFPKINPKTDQRIIVHLTLAIQYSLIFFKLKFNRLIFVVA